MPRAKDAVPMALPAPAAPGRGLPPGWEEATCEDGKVYFIDHNARRTSWIDPRDHFTKPRTFSDCIGHELPLGWEECYDSVISTYYVDHINERNQLDDPRLQCHDEQENMLKEYLKHAADDLESQQQQQLQQEEEQQQYIDQQPEQQQIELQQLQQQQYIEQQQFYQHESVHNGSTDNISDQRSNASSRRVSRDSSRRPSTGSCTPLAESSVDPVGYPLSDSMSEDTRSLVSDTNESVSSKYNPRELKEYIASAHQRVDNLKREMSTTRTGETVPDERVADGFTNSDRGSLNSESKSLNSSDEAFPVHDLREVHKRLLYGEREKIQIIKELLKQKEECCDNLPLNRKKKNSNDNMNHSNNNNNQINGSTTSLNSQGSACSTPSLQLMGSSENIGTGMVKRQLHKDYQVAMLKVKELQDALQVS